MPNLVGIGNSQVPTNAMLGGLAYQDPAHANLTSVEIENIAAIKAIISPTDQRGSTGTTKKSVFVYDTRNDSDGGAWRKRTQHCTWYNEELGTQWRGNRREFPSVAILVTHEGGQFFGFTIYDGDDPNCSMWLNWHLPQYNPTSNWGSGIPHIGRANFVGYTPGAISALNGQIVMANDGSAGSTATWQPGWMINMISEKCLDVVSYGSATSQTYWVSSDISGRVKWADHSGAGTNNYVQGNRYGSSDSVLSEGKSGITGKPTKGNVKSISMTVEPGAMTDELTGLPTPTQAWGREDGVSVMRGTNNTWVNDGWGNYDVHATDFSSIHDLVAVNRSGNVVGTVLWDNKDGYGAEETGAGSYYHYNLSMALNPSLGVVHTDNEDVRFMPSPYGGPDDLAVIPSSNRGLNLYMGGGIDHSSHASCSRICARITKDYNTGWMMGDCSIALLMDIVATDLTTDIHVDESFDATGSWGMADNASISSGSLHLDNTTNSRATHNTFLVANTSYMCRYHVSNNVNNWKFDDDGSGAGLSGTSIYQNIHHGDDGTFTFVFKTTASTRLRIIREASSNSNNISISYIRFYKIQKGDNTSADDRNITYGGGKNFGGATVGKLVRNSVSTQASSTHPTKGNSELVGYSSFGDGSGGSPTTGHLVVGYNSDKFDIGTNDFLVMGWVYPPAGQSSSHQLLGVGDADHNDGFLVEINSGTGWFLDMGYLGVSNSFASSNGGTAVYAALQGDQWNMWAIYKQGSNFRLYTNGEYCGNDFGSSSVNWTTKWKAPHMTIGGRAGNLGGATNAWPHPSMRQAMIRFGQTYSSWTDDDFRRVYEDERKLFGHDVQCTLYGEQTDIATMDYDKSTGLLHVGTSASGGGRSDFRRLVRINNTTDPITKVSASGGLIAEY